MFLIKWLIKGSFLFAQPEQWFIKVKLERSIKTSYILPITLTLMVPLAVPWLFSRVIA